MSTRHPKPSYEQDAPPSPRKRVPRVHLEQIDGRWALRVGRRAEATFDDQDKAVRAGMRRARKLSARLFYHRPDGRIQEAATSEADEMFLDLWHRIYDHHNPATN